MIRKISSYKKFFSVSSSDWQTVVEAESKEEAAEKGFRRAYAIYKDNLNLSTLIFVCDLSNLDETIEHETHMMYAPTVILDAGFPELSRGLEGVISDIEKNS